jgi:hypothetical protein
VRRWASTVRALALAALATGGCKPSEGKPAPSGSASAAAVVAAAKVLEVPRTSVPIKLDGELDEPVWNALSVRSGPFVDATGAEARPYSDARFLWDADNLYISLYAADDDIRANVTAHDGPVWIDDAFALRLTPDASGATAYAFDISASGTVTDLKRVRGSNDDLAWESGIKVGVDRDGTLNDPSDNDEEWVLEAAIPLRSLGLDPQAGARLQIEISRCDTPKGTARKRCGTFGAGSERRVLQLAP